MKTNENQLLSIRDWLIKKQGFDALPDTAFVREAELVRTEVNPSGVLPFSPHTLWRKVREGSFPHPHKLASRVTAWRVKDVRDWMTSLTK